MVSGRAAARLEATLLRGEACEEQGSGNPATVIAILSKGIADVGSLSRIGHTMTSNNFDKRAVRARMAATGESYSVAARALAALPTPTWPELDKLIGGFQPGHLYVFGAAPKSGATLFATNLVDRLSRPNEHLLYCSLERTVAETYEALVTAAVGKTTLDEPFAELTVRAAYHLQKNVKVLEWPLTTDGLYAEVAAQPQVRAVVVDYLQLLEEYGMPGSLPRAEVFAKRERIISVLKSIATTFEVPVIVFAHLRLDRPALMGEATWPGSLQQTASLVAQLERQSEGQALCVKLIKNRQGPCGEVLLQRSTPWSRRLLDKSEISV